MTDFTANSSLDDYGLASEDDMAGYQRLHEIPNILPFDRDASYEAELMPDAEDNVYSRDPRNLEISWSPYYLPGADMELSGSSREAVAGLQVPISLDQYADPSRTAASRRSTPIRDWSIRTSTPSSKSSDRQKSTTPIKPLIKLELGFAWDKQSLALLCRCKEVSKKGIQAIVASAVFPGHTKESLEEVWAVHKAAARQFYQELYVNN